jgi:AcrR family transcriptional regulator
VLNAASELLLEHGVAGTSVEAIAARAGVSKMTIYRWWPTRSDILLESFFEHTRSTTDKVATDTAARALERQLQNTVALVVDGRLGALLRELIALGQSDQQVREALNTRWLAPRRAVATSIIEDGIAAGEFASDLDIDLAVDQLFAPIYYRLLLGHAPLDASIAAIAVTQLLTGIATGIPGTAASGRVRDYAAASLGAATDSRESTTSGGAATRSTRSPACILKKPSSTASASAGIENATDESRGQ